MLVSAYSFHVRRSEEHFLWHYLHMAGSKIPRKRLARAARAKRSRQRLSKAERRQMLIEKAGQLFGNSGARATTTRDLARAAKVSEALLFQHFPNKAALFAAVLEQKVLEIWPEQCFTKLKALQQAGDDEGFIRALYTHIIINFGNHPEHTRLWLYSALEPNQATAAIRNSIAPLQRLLREFVATSQQAGRFRPDASVGILVRMLLALPYYFVLQQQLFRTPWQMAEPEEFLDVGVEFALAGLRTAGKDATSRQSIADVDMVSVE